MASAPVLGEVGVAVDGTIDPLLAKFAAAEKAADAFAARMQRKLKGVQIGGGGGANDNAERAADRMGKSLDRAGAAGQRYHQTLIQINNDNRTLIQVTDNSSRSFNRFSQSIDQSNRSINNHITNQRAAAGAARDSAHALGETDAAASGLRRTLLASASVIAGAFGLNELKNTADSYTRFTNQLKVAGLEGSNLGRTQEELFQSAQRYGVELEGLGTLYGRLAQSQNALGATSQQTMRFVNGVAAAIKVQGATAPQVQGALMQLSQAMGSTLVRAEEFNSINEGARPILVAVANGIEKYRGSVSALRNDVINGKLTSQEFFQGFLAGSSQLESQATRANLTIGASFTVLNNALGRYIGQTDQSLSATQRIGGGIQALARNLDVIMPILTAIILAMGARYAVAAGTMIASTSLAQLALAAFRMVTQGTIVSVVALGEAGAVAGRSLLAAFGGPVGIAILAVGAAVYYFYQRSQEASKAVADFNLHQKEAAKVLETERARASAAGGAIKQLGTDHGTAANQIKSFAGATGDAAKALYEQARAARRARFETLAYTLEQAKADKAKADQYVAENRQSDQSRARFGNLPENPEVQKARDRSAAAQRTIDQVQAVIDRAVRDPLESYVPNARTGGRDLAAEIAQLQQQLVAAQKAGLTEQQREILKQIKIRKRITELMQQGLNLEIASAQADTEALGPRGAAPENGATRFGSPVAGRRITGRFGERRPGHTHAGVDIAVPAGTAVQATAGGTVIEAGTLPGYGNVIIIDHGRGMTTRYAHLSKLGVAKGTRVDAGQQIGLSGGVPGAPGAGRSTGAHLHYEVRKNGRAVDPNGAYAIDEVDAANKAEQLENQRLAREQAFGAQSQQLQDAILQARESQLVDEAAIAQAAKDRINGERDRTRDEIESKRKRKEYDDTQAAQLTAANEELRAAQLAANDFKERQRLAEQAVRIAERTHGWEMEALEAQQDIARTATERRAAERRILAAQKEYERQVLQAKIDSPFSKPEDRDAARHELGTLDERYGRRTGRLDREAIEDMYQAAPGDSAIGIRDQQRGIRRDRDDRLGAVDEGTQALLKNEQLTQDERARILQEAADRRVAIEADAQKRILDLETQRKTLQLQNAQDIADGLASIAEGIAGKQSGIYRGLFAASKAFAIAQASIALYQNVAEAMKVGFPQNLPLIAAAVAQGASIVSNIQAVSAQFDTGGWTGNMSRYAPAGTVHGQEFVVRAGPAARHRPMLEDINAGRDPTIGVSAQARESGGLMRGGQQGSRVSVKQMPGVAIEVRENMTTGDVELIAKRAVEKHAPTVVSRDMRDPNSRTSKAIKSTTTARPRRS